MVYELKETSKVEALFRDFDDTLVISCLQQVMGKIFVTDLNAPRSALAYLGCFGFLAGETNPELLDAIPEGFSIIVPYTDDYSCVIRNRFHDAREVTRYALRKDAVFDVDSLSDALNYLPDGCELRRIDSGLYEKCFLNPLTRDFVSSFDCKENFLKYGLGYVIDKNGVIVSGASSYSRYRGGIEIEVDTIETERRKHLAYVCCSALILDCINRGLYPSWDAQNIKSLRLAEKLGYVLDREYIAYEVLF